MQFEARPRDTFIRSYNDGAATIATFDLLGDAHKRASKSPVRIPNQSESRGTTHSFLTGSAPVYLELMNDNYFELSEKVCAVTNGIDIANDRLECDAHAWSGSFEDADRGID